MKRTLLVVLILMAAVLGSILGWLAVAQPGISGHIVSDLQLISQESKVYWSPAWTGPIQAATILAWLAEHGYPAFIGDFNGDGVIDELDTIELADIFGRNLMETRSPRGTTDVRLVLGLARYVADRYPNQFELKIYDAGFPVEFSAEEGMAFNPHIIDGIVLNPKNEPSIAAYKFELESGEGVIIGLEEEENYNTYLSGRSFLYDTTPEGYTPIDLAWAEEARWVEGHQGKVLETVGRMADRFYLEYRGEWTLVEFMLALSPIDNVGATGPGDSCASCHGGEPDDREHGACCFRDGMCIEMSGAECDDAGGIAYVDGALCDEIDCNEPDDGKRGACCLPNGSCAEGTEAGCAEAGGIYYGTGSSCWEIRCDEPRGACCRPGVVGAALGICTEETEANCVQTGGTYYGDGSLCMEIDCDEPDDGACCLPDGLCAEELDATQCRRYGGTYYDDGTTCSEIDCEPIEPEPDDGEPGQPDDGEPGQPDDSGTGACWSPRQVCSEMSSADCAAGGGSYSGDGTTCP